MSNRSRLRLIVMRVLVVSVLATLLGRLWFLQVYAGQTYTQAAMDNRVRSVVEPARRGQIYDSSGVPLVVNRNAMVVSVNKSLLRQEKDRGKAVLARLSAVVNLPVDEIVRLTTGCGERLPDGTLAKSPNCWNGSPYQPVPVKAYTAEDPAQMKVVLAIEEHREDFPGVTAELQPVRDYPDKTLAAHLLGYLGPISDAERKQPQYANALNTAKVGRSGVEETYDAALRGIDGKQQLVVDKDGNVTSQQSAVPPKAGDALVLSLDKGVQKLAEDALQRWIMNARGTYDRVSGKNYLAPSGSVVVMEAQTGRIAAMASYPSYDPSIFSKPITQKTYDALVDQKNGAPLYSNATQGTFPPGSTFKLVSTVAAAAAGNSLNGSFSCPPSLMLGNQKFGNFEGEAFGTIDMRTTLVKSCDTVYYKLAYNEWQRDGGLSTKGPAREIFPATAREFGFGTPTGVDLPSDSAGSIVSRASKIANYKRYKDDYCAGAKNPTYDAYRRAIDAENCVDGALYKGGEAALFAIGQGDVNSTPLQLASAYAALANGGTLYAPRVAKALLSADGTKVTPIPPAVKSKLSTPPGVLDYIRSALQGVTLPGGTAQAAYAGFPHNIVPVAGKTGTADIQGKQPVSWFASFAPANAPRYVVVAMVTQGGTGGTTAAPITREIYDGMYGLEGKAALLKNGELPSALPVVRPDGTLGPPGTKTGRPAPTVVMPASPSPVPSSSGQGSSASGPLPAAEPARRTSVQPRT
jgi:penicillin-binding protein 2